MSDRTCPSCAAAGHPETDWPETAEFWPVRHGRLHFGKCKACRYEQRIKTDWHFRRMIRKQSRKMQRAAA